jgi:hypothetical protein
VNATEHLIEAFRANKRGDLQPELNKLQAVADASRECHGPALDLRALLSALAEIVVGEPCVAVPVREVEACRDEWSDVPKNGLRWLATEPILARLTAPKVDHVAELRALLESVKTNADNCRDLDISGAEWWRAKIGPLEAAIKKMDEKP